MLNKQRRVKPLFNKAVKEGRMVKERFGVDPDRLHWRPRLYPAVWAARPCRSRIKRRISLKEDPSGK